MQISGKPGDLMKVAVTDAGVFIDLIELEIISCLFRLDIERHATVAVMKGLPEGVFPKNQRTHFQGGHTLPNHYDFLELRKLLQISRFWAFCPKLKIVNRDKITIVIYIFVKNHQIFI